LFREFEWDPAKAKRNLSVHGVSFEEAVTVFSDPKKVGLVDVEHSEREERDIVIGYSTKTRLLMVVATQRHEAIRIISARKANANEARRYAQGY
jgi:uncharacterized protein